MVARLRVVVSSVSRETVAVTTSRIGEPTTPRRPGSRNCGRAAVPRPRGAVKVSGPRPGGRVPHLRRTQGAQPVGAGGAAKRPPHGDGSRAKRHGVEHGSVRPTTPATARAPRLAFGRHAQPGISPTATGHRRPSLVRHAAEAMVATSLHHVRPTEGEEVALPP